MEDPLDFIEEEKSSGPDRDEHGRFKPSDVKAAETPSAEPEPPSPEPQPPAPVAPPVEVPPPEPVQPPPGYVPVSVMQALREENRRLKTPPPQAQQVPDRYEDPEAYDQWRDQQVYQQTLNTKLDLSEDIARTHHGDEAVDKARDWALQRFEASPAYYQEVMGSRNPYAKIVADHQRDELVTQLKPEDFQAFRAWQQAQAAIQPVAAPPAAAPPNRPPAPRSPMSQLAAAGGSKPGQEPVYPGKAFEDVFPK